MKAGSMSAIRTPSFEATGWDQSSQSKFVLNYRLLCASVSTRNGTYLTCWPYAFWFRIELSNQESLKTSLEDLNGNTVPISLVKDLFKGDAAQTSLVGQCFPSNEP